MTTVSVTRTSTVHIEVTPPEEAILRAVYEHSGLIAAIKAYRYMRGLANLGNDSLLEAKQVVEALREIWDSKKESSRVTPAPRPATIGDIIKRVEASRQGRSNLFDELFGGEQ